jgi:glutaredoxin
VKRLLMNVSVLVALGSFAAGAASQYKWVTPEGKTVYSDLPPPASEKLLKDVATVQPTPLAPAGAPRSAPTPELPYGLKVATNRSPVVLYTAPECPPCLAARRHLSARGVPFTEKVVEGSADFEAFKALGLSNNTFPAVTVGAEKSIGFEAVAYDRLLDAAGYPPSSRLPSGYARSAPEPLSPPQAQSPVGESNREQAAGGGGNGRPPARSAATADRPTIDRYRSDTAPAAAAGAADTPAVRF